jgi:hypothetical protein
MISTFPVIIPSGGGEKEHTAAGYCVAGTEEEIFAPAAGDVFDGHL